MKRWNENIFRLPDGEFEKVANPDEKVPDNRKRIEPWLSALFQSEHLSLLLGNGFTMGVCGALGVDPPTMRRVEFSADEVDRVNEVAGKSAARMGRGEANFEDQLRAATDLVNGLTVLGDEDRATKWRTEISRVLAELAQDVVAAERRIAETLSAGGTSGDNDGEESTDALGAFLLSLASRSTTRERLCVFTTNYDRVFEHGCDKLGLRILDRFVGHVRPIFRASRLDVDMHYNPPGIRGEPRYLEGVVKLTKLHGSVDWRFQDARVEKVALPFGPDSGDMSAALGESLVVYPNASKDVETLEFPYSELFRDLSATICRPNTVLVTYGYGFGDSHINSALTDMLTIPSTHLVLISFDDAAGRIPRFCEEVGRPAQISLLLGDHFGDLKTLSRNYMPKPAIDRVSARRSDLLRRREPGTEAPTESEGE